MTQAEVLQQLSSFIGRVLEREPVPLEPSTDLVVDLGLDSLALAELASLVRSTYKIKLRANEVHSDFRAGTLADLILQRLSSQG